MLNKIKNLFAHEPNLEKSQIKQLENEIDELKQKLEENYDDQIALVEKYAIEGFSKGYGNFYDLVHEEIDAATLQRLYTSEGWFYISVSTIVNAIMTLPWVVEKKKLIKHEDENGNVSYDETWIEANGEPEYDLLQYPNGMQIPIEFWTLILIDLLTTGKAYIFTDLADDPILENRPLARLQEVMARRRKCRTEAMYRLNSAMVEPRFKEDCSLDFYEYQTSEGTYKFDPTYIIPIQLPNPLDSYKGLAPIIPVLKNLLIDRFSSEHMIRFYKQGARLGGVITTEKKLTKEQMGRITRSFEQNYTGKRNHHRTLILPQGMKYEVIEQNPGETSLIEFSKFNKEPILSAYNVPPIKVGLLDGATYANALIQYKVFWEDAVKPVANILVSAINFSDNIFSMSRQLRCRFDYSDVQALQEDQSVKADTAKKYLNSGWTVNEVRKEVWDKEGIDGGDRSPSVVNMNNSGMNSIFSTLGIKPITSKEQGNNAQPDTALNSDVKPTTITFAERVAQLVAVNMANGLPYNAAMSAAIEQAITEGFLPVEAAVKPTEEVQDDEQATSTEGEDDKQPEEPVEPEEDKVIYGNVQGKHLFEYAKALTGEGVKVLIDERFDEAVKYFKKLEKVFVDAAKDIKTDDDGNIIKTIYCLKKKGKEKFGIMPNIKADESGLPTDKVLAQMALEEADNLSDAELKAMMHGFENSIPSHATTFPNDEAAAYLTARAGDKIVGITDTTKLQIRKVILEAYKDQVSPNELGARIHEKFEEIMNYEGRAMTIARTETLSAVSEGQEFKKDKFLEEVPDAEEKLEKTWITAEDERVRPSHAQVNNETVKHNEDFSNGLKYPREKGAPAGEVINCRCAVIYHTEEDTGLIGSILEGFGL